MENDEKIKKEIRHFKKHEKRGCLFWFFIFFVGIPFIFIVYSIGEFFYEMDYKETELVTSYSPNNNKMIKVVQKGQPLYFSPASVRIYYGKSNELDVFIKSSISNDGGNGRSEDIIIKWEDNEKATVIITGEEQEPETIEISF